MRAAFCFGALNYFEGSMSACIVSARDRSSMFGPGEGPAQRWMIPTNTMSFVGSTQNQVPAMPSHRNVPLPTLVPRRVGSS